jgi:hypothetical protein
MTSTIRPTARALLLHRSHLATTHRAPLVRRPEHGARARARAFTPLPRDPLSVERQPSQNHES